MNGDLQALRDIHDGLGNPWWPLAPGWWLIAVALLALAVLVWSRRRRWPRLPPIPLLHLGSWRWDAHRELRRLRQSDPSVSVKARATALSELLKRIAMARHGRAACAGLHGRRWLDWLTRHDPDGFDWCGEGQLLTQAPYAPERTDDAAGTERLARLIDASERWIRVRPKRARDTRRRRLVARRLPGIGTRWTRLLAGSRRGAEVQPGVQTGLQTGLQTGEQPGEQPAPLQARPEAP